MSLLDEKINGLFTPISETISSVVFYSINVGGKPLPLILLWLVSAGVIFTLYFRFISIRGFAHAVRVVRGVYENPKSKGSVSHFQALSTALSGTVGLGNIAGVAIAISLGGPGATFWMIVCGVLGMSSKFVECTLGVKYRTFHKDGHLLGGPMMYLSRGLAEQGRPKLGRVLAVVFSICCIGGTFGATSLFQTNQAYQQFVSVMGGPESFIGQNGWLYGVVMAFFVGIVVIGGIKTIGRVAGKIVPFMCGVYVLGALAVIFHHWQGIPNALNIIWHSAFDPAAAYGGIIGVMIQGFKRGAFSNEAGLGSAAIAHSAVKTDEPVDEGFVALLEPFIDTVIICTMTALVIVLTGFYDNQATLGGVEITSQAFQSVMPWFPPVLMVCVTLFAYSTMISWGWYGIKATDYLSNHNKKAEMVFKVVFLLATVVGAATNLESVVNLTDSLIFIMAVPNIIGLYLLAPVVKKELEQYEKKLKLGKIKRYK